MNIKRTNRQQGEAHWRKLLCRFLPMMLALVALFTTGCPHNEYVVQLKPQGEGIKRTLSFYAADGVDTNTAAPKYEYMDGVQLTAIRAWYPAGAVTNDGPRYRACGTFTNQLPGDVGGAGLYIQAASSLGEAGFYTERFRGNDDFGGLLERRFQAANQVADLMVGWSGAELGREPGYEKLHRFLDVDVRRDLKNVAAYWWAGQLASQYQTNAPEEFMVRFGQYLWEHGYYKGEDIPGLFREASANDSMALTRRVQRFVATTMGVPETNPVPAALDFLGDEKKLEASFEKYTAGTEAYRDRLCQYEVDKRSKPDAKQPKPDDLLQDPIAGLVDFNLFGRPDRLTVRLCLASAPARSNGRWDGALRQVVWETDLGEKMNAAPIPFVCYATWAQPDDTFQIKHFGRRILAGDDLVQYCLWRKSLDARHGMEWDAFLSGLEPGRELGAKLDAFRFADETEGTVTNGQPGISLRPDYVRQQLKAAIR